ncbi:MAG: D-hexose-6-phosphate mutarotase, partial [Terriglobia bacterium]
LGTRADVRRISISGLEGTTYLDKTEGMRRKVRPDQPIAFSQETDQVHVNTEATCVIDDPVWNRRITIAKTGSLSTVVWNPWIEKAAAMPDFSPDEWQRMVCVETANVGENAVTIDAGQSHVMTVTISL